MSRAIRHLILDERGQGTIEYALLGGAFGFAAFGAVGYLQQALVDLYASSEKTAQSLAEVPDLVEASESPKKLRP